MVTVFAAAIHKNLRSRHVLRKVGFRATHQDDTFITDVTATVGISQINKSSIYLYIIAHPQSERNKIKILLRSESPILKGQCLAFLNRCAVPLPPPAASGPCSLVTK